MTYYIIIVLCIIVLLAYLFDVTSKYSKIPGVILLISLGIGIQLIVNASGFKVPNMQPVLPILGTLGLILIVLEAGLDIKLEKKKTRLILKSVYSAIFLFAIFTVILSFILIKAFGFPVKESILNTIPLGIISSAVAISSATHLNSDQKEFIIYESSISDVVGILAFGFILNNYDSIGHGLFSFAINGVITAVIAIVFTTGLGYLLHTIKYHVNYVIIMTSVVLVYVVAELFHLPALILVLVFGLALSNYKLIEDSKLNKFVDFGKFRTDVDSFQMILIELTFLVRSFFFIMFGYYTQVNSLFSINNIILALVIVVGIFLLRWLFFRLVLKIHNLSIILFAPRGLITILLFLGIPAATRIPLINVEIITLVILMTLLIMMVGNFFSASRNNQPEPDVEKEIKKSPI
jgi:potassium/hydrogen antiporter